MMSLKERLEQVQSKKFDVINPELYQSELVGIARGETETCIMLDFQFRDGKSRSLCYTDLREIVFDASEGLELYFHSLRFNLLKVQIVGRNLVPIHEMLKQHRVTYIRENPSEVDDLEEKQVFIEEVRVEEVD
jgi:hypothetical protein